MSVYKEIVNALPSYKLPPQMKCPHAHLLVMFVIGFALATQAQSPSAGATGQSSDKAVVEGLVTRDPGSEPVKKALIELIAENQNTGGNYTAITEADGKFRIEGIVPGRYRLMVERTGFVEVERRQARTDGRILTLSAGQELKDVLIRLQATAVVDGRVTDEDGEPLADAQVRVQRRTFAGGHNHWEPAGTERTNDLGEYRISGLSAGRYYISVTPPPNLKNLIETPSNKPSGEISGNGEQDKPPPASYATSYYPGVRDRAQASAVQLRAGEDFPANLSLTPSPTVAIRGSVANIPAGGSVVVMLRSAEANSFTTATEVRKNGGFEIREVSPGNYTLLAMVIGGNAGAPMARQELDVGADNIIGLRITLQAGGEIHGRFRVEGNGSPAKLDLSQCFLALRSADGDDDMGLMFSADDSFSNLAHVAADGTVQWKNVPAGRYFIVLSGGGDVSADWFLKSGMAGGRDVVENGFDISGGSVGLDLLASGKGAVLDGAVTNHKGEAVDNATVVLIPEQRFRSRVDRFRTTVTDQAGRFALHAISPGTYTLLAWASVDGDEYYDPEFLKSYEVQGKVMHLAEGDHNRVQVEAVPMPEDRQ
ncbi:MAG: carboxypeptidase-like regulatory domain-containing protein [Candidatus Sulfotelmatobacter sp.]